MRVAAYLRVSTDIQAENGMGLDVQRQAIKEWAKAHKHRVALWTSDDGVSGSNGLDNRSGLLDAVQAIRDKAVLGIVVYRLDRLARDLVLQEQLLAEVWRMGGHVWSCSQSEDAYLQPDGDGSDPSRKLIRQVLGAVAEYERAMIRLRLRSGKARKAANGGWIGGQVPYGWDAVDGQLTENEVEQRALRLMRQLHARGLSSRQICSQLEAEGHRTKRGATNWQPRVVTRLLATS
jgi:DNA invertase Pin-like site-specific DNA recombinase